MKSNRGIFALVLTALLLVGMPDLGWAAAKPRARHGWSEVTKASWYGHSFHGRQTAGGGRFNANRLTAAHPSLRIGSKVRVIEVGSGKSVVVQITDRGPYIRGRGIDLSYAAARQLGLLERGVARVRIELISPEKPSPIVVAAATQTSGPLRAIVE